MIYHNDNNKKAAKTKGRKVETLKLLRFINEKRRRKRDKKHF